MSTVAPPLRHTSLHALHKSAGARLVPFAGYDMPVQYKGIIQEHKAVREAAGLFDVSHMGFAKCTGAQAQEFLNFAVTRDLSALAVGHAAYSLLCKEDGGTIDDLIVYRANQTEFHLILNASNKDVDMAQLRALANNFNGDVNLEGPLDTMSLLALQGPRSGEILEKAGTRAEPFQGGKLPAPFHYFEATIAGIPVRLATTGYTGESGVEIFVASDRAPKLWQKLLEAGKPLGLEPCGLGARDTLRTEMGYSLYGHELTEEINPVEAGLSWAVGFAKPKFVGRDAITQAKAAPRRKLIALKNESSRQAPRPGMNIVDASGRPVGTVTSGTFSPSLGYVIGLGLVEAASQAPYQIDIRGQQSPFELTKRPFYKKPT